MAISLKDLINNPGLIETLRLHDDRGKCIRCGATGYLPHDEPYLILQTPANPDICPECHFRAVGDAIEKSGEDSARNDAHIYN